MSKQIDPRDWTTFLEDFSERNKGRRARFELFHRDGDVREEEQDAHFEGAALNGRTVSVRRTDRSGGEPVDLALDVSDTHGIAVQYDTDGSEDTLEFTNHQGDMTVLHFQSKVDGDS